MSHDSTAFYARFPPVVPTTDTTIAACEAAGSLVCGDARSMVEVADCSVALVVTSPPYGCGKDYELEGVGPADYDEYLTMLRDAFSECRRVLEPGGRLAVNVANLGRKPYRPLSADLWRMLEADLGLLPRGEIIWRKHAGAGGSCAFGSFRKPSNPVLRDVTERVLLLSKGRFDRALHWKVRRERGLPWQATISTEDFLRATLDVWDIPAESATRVGHPAPFPVELPRRLIELFTYADDVVLDPFVGSGTTAVAAVAAGRRYVGYDNDPGYVTAARQRIALEVQRVEAQRALRLSDA